MMKNYEIKGLVKKKSLSVNINTMILMAYIYNLIDQFPICNGINIKWS